MNAGSADQTPPVGGATDGAAPTRPLAATAALVGAYRWVEHRLFELTGAWSLDGAVPALQVHLSEASLQHAWHAELWEDRLPVLASVDRAALTRPPPALAESLDALAAADDPVSRLAGLQRVVLPRLLVSYDRHAASTSAVADGPVRRALALAGRDLSDEWRKGEALLEAALADAAAAQRAAAATRKVESALLGGGPGLFGSLGSAEPGGSPPGPGFRT